MKAKKRSVSRRHFLKTAGVAGVGSLLSTSGVLNKNAIASSQQGSGTSRVPKRPFGKTGVNVSALSLGGMIYFPNNQILLRQALKMGVSYWDTSERYERGGSEEGIGQYFNKYPQDRKNVFLVTKTTSRDPSRMTEALNQSLKRLQTNYVDLYFLHAVSGGELNQSIRTWAQKAKASGKIKLFGVSTHRNMDKVLMEASKADYIDGIMLTYNYRIMNDPAMQAAVDACTKAGIGLTAMKTQAKSQWSNMGKAGAAADKLTEKFMRKGFTVEQAKLKAVWENPKIASICSHMPNMTVLQANVAALLDKTNLSFNDKAMLDQYAHATAHLYCAGCTAICESVLANNIPVGNVMRYLMYARGYHDRERAQTLFQTISPGMQQRLIHTDFTDAERVCPRKVAIGRLMREAVAELA